MLQQLHREKHVDVVRQVEVFEQEMQADNEEVTLMTKQEQALAADQPASLNLERSASMESVGDGEKPSGDHVPDALGPAVGSPLARFAPVCSLAPSYAHATRHIASRRGHRT